nr:AAA domain-containing protein [Mycoplasma phocoeninasale]
MINNSQNSIDQKAIEENKFEKYIKNLNKEQIEAFMKSVDGSPITLIKGPPGTGKTHVINSIIQYLTKEENQKVIISSQTHIAIDNVLDKIMENHEIIIPNRITNRRNRYDSANINLTLYETWGKNFEKFNRELIDDKELANKMINDIKKFSGKPSFSAQISNDSYMVIGATTTTTNIGGKKGHEVLKGYDWLIIDEISKCPISEVLRYIPYVKHIILVGDDYQLSPLLEFNDEDVKECPSYDEEMFNKLKKVYEESIFSKTIRKAREANRLIILKENYRSVKSILDVYNVFYDNELINRRESMKTEKVQFKKKLWNEKDVFFVEVKGGSEVKDPKSHSRYNLNEIEATKEILRNLIKFTVDPLNVDVAAIFPYAAQISEFQKANIELINKARKHFRSFEIDTVDAFQGKESDIVLVNTVVTTNERNFLNDFRRINVSLSRARDKLFIFGNSITLGNISMKTANSNQRKYFAQIHHYIKNNGALLEYTIEKGIKDDNEIED